MIIKKLNSMFHKHSRWLFGIFAVIIIIAFMDFLTPGAGGCNSNDPSDLQIGSINGEKVTYGELQSFGKKFADYLNIMGRNQQQLDNQSILFYYALSKRMEKMGFHISDKQASEIVKSSPRFRKNGEFDIKEYNQFLKQTRIKEADVIAAIRVGALAEEYSKMIKNSIAVSDAEIEDKFYSLETKYDVKTITIDSKLFLKDIKAATDKELKDFFTINQSNGAYMHPVKNSVLVAELPREKFEKAAADKLTKKELDAYIATRKKELAESKTKMSDDELEKEKIAMDASVLATAEGKKFPAAFQSLKTLRPEEREAQFRAIAQKLGLKITATGLQANPAFDQMPVRTCQLFPTGAVFVVSRTDSKPMTFDEAKKATLAEDYRNSKAMEKAIEVAGSKAGLQKLIADKKVQIKDDKIEIANLYYMLKQCEKMVSRELEQAKPNFNTIGFLQQQMMMITRQIEMSGQVTMLKEGEYGKPFPASETSVILWQLIKRNKPADAKALDAEKRNFIREDIVSVKAQMMLNELFNAVSKECKYTADDRNPRK